MSKRTTTDTDAMLAFMDNDSIHAQGETNVIPAIAHGAKDPKILNGQLNKAMSHNEELQRLVNEQKEMLEAKSGDTFKAHKSRFRTDKNQYRKTIKQETIDLRQKQMESKGQLAPFLVLPLTTDENGELYYPILNGNTRHMAFMQSDILQEVEAKIFTGDVSNIGNKTIIQMLLNDEGSESVPILERAEGYRIAAEHFGSQQAVADELGIDKGRVSAVMGLLKLPENIQVISKENDINDAKVLKAIAKVQVFNEELAKQLVAELKVNSDDVTGTKPSARDTVNKYLSKLPKPKSKGKKTSAKKENKKEKLPAMDSVNLALATTNTKLVLNIELKKKIARFNITNEMLDTLIEQRKELEK